METQYTNIKNAIEQIQDRISMSDHILLLNALESDREANRIYQDNCIKKQTNNVNEFILERARRELEFVQDQVKAGNRYAKAHLPMVQRAYDEALIKKNNDMI